MSHKTSQADLIDKKILDLTSQNPKITDEEIGNELGLSREAVNRRKKRKGFQLLLQENLEVSKNNINNLVRKSLSELEYLLSDPDPRIRLTAVSLALKFMPEKSGLVVSKELLGELIKQENFFEELFNIPGAGHACVMIIFNKLNKN